MNRLISPLAIVFLIAGCETLPPAPVEEISTDRTAGEEASADDVQLYALPELKEAPRSTEEETERSVAETLSLSSELAAANTMRPQAVQALLDEAEKAEQEKRYIYASAQLERALRIEPNDPQLWHRLAVLRMKQQQYSDAIKHASRSNDHTFGDNTLKVRNWRLIAAAYEKLENGTAVESALKQASILESKIVN